MPESGCNFSLQSNRVIEQPIALKPASDCRLFERWKPVNRAAGNCHEQRHGIIDKALAGLASLSRRWLRAFSQLNS